ncbi:hypothetical protein [Cohnella hashimotonis]|uniref:ABC transporter permease n=1 Tax=Cohnella hashimotonis TaxID=2826895 RepID=A0ABT6TD55_9BACL|nr:hypothetical protein [Cohnella hashimotonis]MDI4644763.1 hypothetical protein [Cohnella hashimotonis]
MIAWSRMLRSLTVGMIVAALAIGLLPFLFADLIGDLNGFADLDSSPFYALINKFIRGGK